MSQPRTERQTTARTPRSAGQARRRRHRIRRSGRTNEAGRACGNRPGPERPADRLRRPRPDREIDGPVSRARRVGDDAQNPTPRRRRSQRARRARSGSPRRGPGCRRRRARETSCRRGRIISPDGEGFSRWTRAVKSDAREPRPDLPHPGPDRVAALDRAPERGVRSERPSRPPFQLRGQSSQLAEIKLLGFGRPGLGDADDDESATRGAAGQLESAPHLIAGRAADPESGRRLSEPRADLHQEQVPAPERASPRDSDSTVPGGIEAVGPRARRPRGAPGGRSRRRCGKPRLGGRRPPWRRPSGTIRKRPSYFLTPTKRPRAIFPAWTFGLHVDHLAAQRLEEGHVAAEDAQGVEGQLLGQHGQVEVDVFGELDLRCLLHFEAVLLEQTLGIPEGTAGRGIS